MDAPKRIGIVGTGLIGAAFAALVARRAPGVTIEAVEPKGSYREAVGARLPNLRWQHCASELDRCDMVFLACPPDTVVPVARQVLEAGKGLVVDFASTKGRIVADLSDAPRFIGAHPLAGGNRPGPFRAEPDALTAAKVVLTPHDGNDEADVERVERFLASLGCTVVRIDATAHDTLLARTSHLPHLLAYGYAGLLARMDEGELGAFASRSTREISRFASLNTRMWAQIFDQNAEAVSSALDELIVELMDLRNAFAGARAGRVEPSLADAARISEILNGSNDDD
ncbi:prephenate dehydrogenase [Palleronia rufa]|uniref:prephenate dehydrogenase n=1 Tax=Palleronia rufa TaxID=1530186 RepID=UPI00055FCDF9|nr:prephenate dehydrogenase [Palleronia rufa]